MSELFEQVLSWEAKDPEFAPTTPKAPIPRGRGVSTEDSISFPAWAGQGNMRKTDNKNWKIFPFRRNRLGRNGFKKYFWQKFTFLKNLWYGI